MQQADGGPFRLPVSGRMVALVQPNGQDELLLVEAGDTADGGDYVALASRLARVLDGDTLDWSRVCVPDLDVCMVRLRQKLLGNWIRADIQCPAASCGQRIDIAFGIDEYLAHHVEQVGVEDDADCDLADEPGWFVPRSGEGVRFRLPTVTDQLSVAGRVDADSELARRCIHPAEASARHRDRIEAAMEVLAPSLSSDLQGSCPECGTVVTLQFDARWYCVQELRQRAAFIYQEVDLLAQRYHWTEAEILALPRRRRAAYAELARLSWRL